MMQDNNWAKNGDPIIIVASDPITKRGVTNRVVMHFVGKRRGSSTGFYYYFTLLAEILHRQSAVQDEDYFKSFWGSINKRLRGLEVEKFRGRC